MEWGERNDIKYSMYITIMLLFICLMFNLNVAFMFVCFLQQINYLPSLKLNYLLFCEREGKGGKY